MKRALSLQTLKAKLSDLYGSSTYHLFLAEDGHGAVNHSRIRMGLSALNAQRKRYNFIESSKCNFCNHKCENPKHFFLYCPAFQTQRQVMLGEMDRHIPGAVQPYLNYLDRKQLALEFCSIIITGTGNSETDMHLFKIVQNFISDTNRFR